MKGEFVFKLLLRNNIGKNRIHYKHGRGSARLNNFHERSRKPQATQKLYLRRPSLSSLENADSDGDGQSEKRHFFFYNYLAINLIGLFCIKNNNKK